jgi:hypothetical protein
MAQSRGQKKQAERMTPMNLKSITLLSFCLCLCFPLVLSAEEVTMTFSEDFSHCNLRFGQQRLIGEAYDVLRMDDLDQTVIVGEPCLPVKVMNVYIPRGKAVSGVRVASVSHHTLSGEYMILPVQQEVPIAAGLVAEPVLPADDIYTLTEPWPSSPVRLETTGNMAGRKIASISIFPVQFVPASRQVIFNDEITIAVDLVDSREESRVPKETENVRNMRNRIVASMIANPADLEQDFSGPATLDPAVAKEYLLICLAAHADEYEVLKDWKTRKGVPAAIETIEDIVATYPGTDDAEQMRNCIIDYYLNQSTMWVAVTLSGTKARYRGCYGRVGGTTDTGIPCDLYFADLDGDWNADGDSYWGETTDGVDMYPDVYVGRLTPSKGTACSTLVHKILTYEGCYAVPTDYQLDMLFMGGLLDEYTDEAMLKNQIDSESVPSRFDPITKLYESSGNLDKPTVMAELNAGYNIINHADHGNINVLEIGTDALYGSDVETLTNGPRYSVFYSTACDPGAFDNVAGCFAKSFVEADSGGGFMVANSRLGWYSSGSPGLGTGDRYDREFFESLFIRDYTHFGVTHADAKVQRIPYSGSNGTNRWTMYSLNLLADPETDIWIDTPIAMVVAHPETIDTDGQTFTVSVMAEGSPLGDARVCLWKEDDIYEVDTTAPNGEAGFAIDPADSGDMLVTVVKEGYLPYLGSTLVSDDASVITTGGAISDGLEMRVMPNPTAGSANIRCSIPKSMIVRSGEVPTVRIFDAAGRLVKTIPVDGETGMVAWDGALADGVSAPPGIYFSKLTYGNAAVTTKFVILR